MELIFRFSCSYQLAGAGEKRVASMLVMPANLQTNNTMSRRVQIQSIASASECCWFQESSSSANFCATRTKNLREYCNVLKFSIETGHETLERIS